MDAVKFCQLVKRSEAVDIPLKAGSGNGFGGFCPCPSLPGFSQAELALILADHSTGKALEELGED